MKEVEKEVPRIVRVQDGTKTIKVYVASDGKEFTNAHACKQYESTFVERAADAKCKEIVSKIERIYDSSLDFAQFPDMWYFPKTEDDAWALARHYRMNRPYVEVFYNYKKTGSILLETWQGFVYEDRGDMPDRVYVYTADYIRDSFNAFIEKFNLPEKK